VIDFVDYVSAGTSLLVQRGNPHAISDLLSLCGQKVTAEAGTTQQDLADQRRRDPATTYRPGCRAAHGFPGPPKY